MFSSRSYVCFGLHTLSLNKILYFHDCMDANSNDALQYLMMLAVFQGGFYFFAVIWGFMFCFPCRSMRILLGNRLWALVYYHDFVKKEQIVKITTFWFLVIHGIHQNLRHELDWFLSMYAGSFLFTEQISISIVLMLYVSVKHKSI